METINEILNDCLEKDRVRTQLNKREYGSVFGRSITETVVSQSLKGADGQDSDISRSSSNRADAEADLAAKVEQAKATQMLLDHQAELEKMEIEWKLEETKMLAEIKQKEAETKLKLEEGKSQLKQLQVESEVKVAEARVRASNSFDMPGNFVDEAGKVALDSPETPTSYAF